MLFYDAELSRDMAEMLGPKLQAKNCYEHAYYIADYCASHLPDPEKVEVLFCYVTFHGGIYVRHAFCLYGDSVIEPLERLEADKVDYSSIAVIRRLDMKTYRGLLLDEQIFALCNSLRDDEVRVVNEVRIDLNVLDLIDLIRPYAKTPEALQEMLARWNAGEGIVIP